MAVPKHANGAARRAAQSQLDGEFRAAVVAQTELDRQAARAALAPGDTPRPDARTMTAAQEKTAWRAALGGLRRIGFR